LLHFEKRRFETFSNNLLGNLGDLTGLGLVAAAGDKRSRKVT
jgi:hypothetical protein